MYRPMLAETSPAPFDDPGFLFEVKWDGYRAIAQTGPSPRFFGRTTELTSAFPELGDLLRGLPPESVLDGEIIAMGEDGRPSFFDMRRPGRRLAYVAFDLLEDGGFPLLKDPLARRRALLREMMDLKVDDRLLFSYGQIGEGKVFFAAVRDLGLEGMMAKHLASPYLAGQRSPLWLKVLNGREAVVSVLLLEQTPGHAWVAHIFEGGRPRGRVLIPRPEISEALLAGVAVRREGPRFLLDPPVRAEVRYRELTPEGRFRHARFRRFLGP